MNVQNISVIGIGRLGFTMSVCWANKGYNVIAVDVDRAKINAMRDNRVPFHEPGLKKLLDGCRHRLRPTDDYDAAVIGSEVTFIVVQTPGDRQGNFSTKYVLETCRRIGSALRNKPRYHLVALTSTVTPGSVEGEIKPRLESHSKKICGVDFGLCYNPVFIALGNVVGDLYNPDFILIGESDVQSGNILSSIYKKFCDKETPIARMSFINAELTKLLVNTFVTMKISYANMTAQLCESLPGADVDVVTGALGLDSRIGTKYLKGALGYGGPCFPRDNLALSYTARRTGTEARLAEVTHTFNTQQINRLAEIILAKLPQNGNVGIPGLSYKPDTDVIDEAQGILLAGLLIEKKIPVVLYDPAAGESAKGFLNARADFAQTAEECIQLTDLIVITTPWEEFKKIPPARFQDSNRRRVIIDCWRILDPARYKNIVEYIPLGIGPPKD